MNKAMMVLLLSLSTAPIASANYADYVCSEYSGDPISFNGAWMQMIGIGVSLGVCLYSGACMGTE